MTMSATSFFARYARDLAEEKEKQMASRLQQREELRSALARVEADIAVAQDAVTRASIYPITGGGIYCPVCWVSGKEAHVRAIGGGTPQFDRYRCNSCDTEFEVPFG
jgi:transposase-like protein